MSEHADTLIQTAELQSLQLDAARWRAVLGSDRVRFIGGARLGTPHALLCVEFYAWHPPTPTETGEAIQLLTEYADALIAAQRKETAE